MAENGPQKNAGIGGAVKTGPLLSDVPGRTDHHAIDVPEGAFVIPADIVSGLGEGNTLAGTKILQNMFPPPLRAGKIKRHSEIPAPSRHMGGAVPIAAAGGEYIVAPETVAEIGGGDLDQGHRTLDEFVQRVRQNTIQQMSSLPPPQK